jgi:hypothetical protein
VIHRNPVEVRLLSPNFFDELLETVAVAVIVFGQYPECVETQHAVPIVAEDVAIAQLDLVDPRTLALGIPTIGC